MPLLDALLLEGPRLNIWIALRSDDCAGSGTEADPFNGSLRFDSPLSVTSITKSGREATVSVANAYADGDVVTMAGATGDDAEFYNGMFTIYEVTSSLFKYWMKQEPSADADGTITAANTHFGLDEVMSPAASMVGANTRIHIGPGVFLSRGWNEDNIGVFVPQSGQKIVGSGMGVTTLRLANVPQWKSNTGGPEQRWSLAKYAVLGTWDHLDSFEISDLTLDCNLDNHLQQGAEFPTLVCSGLFVPGAHVRIRRVRAIHFGSTRISFGGTANIYECFVLNTAYATVDHPEAMDCVLEDCLIEEPAHSQGDIVTCLIFGAGEDPTTGVMAYPRGCVIRNCLIDCEFKDNPVPVESIHYINPTRIATVTTRLPHGRLNGDWVRISGVVVNGTNPFNGAFQVSDINAYGFSYEMPTTAGGDPAGDIWVGRFPSQLMAATLSKNGTTVTATSATPHFKVPGDVVRVFSGTGSYAEIVRITSIPGNPRDPTKFEYTTTQSSVPASGLVGAPLQGFTIASGKSAVAEGNRIINTRIGGSYHDTWNGGSYTLRNNYYSAVATGPFSNMGGWSTIPGTPQYLRAGQSLLRDAGDHTIATFTTFNPHGFQSGQAVKVEAFKGGNPNNAFAGYFSVTVDPNANATSFSYRMAADPNADSADANPPPKFGALWQTQWMSIENNIVELIGNTTGWGFPCGMPIMRYQNTQQDFQEQRIFLRALIRSNVVRHVEGASNPGGASYAILLDQVDSAQVEHNVIDLNNQEAVGHFTANKVRYFLNTNPAGTLVQGVLADPPPPRKQDELATIVEDALLVCL